MYKSLHLKLFINRFGLKINSTFLLYSELYWVFLLLLEINTLILLKWQMCFWWSDVNLFTILHTQTHAHTHTLTHIRTIFAAISLSHSLTLSLCRCVASGGLSRSISSAWMVSSSAKGSDGDSVSATSTLAAPGIYYRLRFLGFFCLFYFWSSSCFFVHSSTFVCVQLLWQFIHQAAKRANKNKNNNGSEAHTTREGDQLRRAAAAPALLLLLLLFLLTTSLYWVSAYKRITCIAIAAASVVVECCTVTMQTFCHTHDKSLFFVSLSLHMTASLPLSLSHCSVASSHPHSSFLSLWHTLDRHKTNCKMTDRL